MSNHKKGGSKNKELCKTKGYACRNMRRMRVICCCRRKMFIAEIDLLTKQGKRTLHRNMKNTKSESTNPFLLFFLLRFFVFRPRTYAECVGVVVWLYIWLRSLYWQYLWFTIRANWLLFAFDTISISQSVSELVAVGVVRRIRIPIDVTVSVCDLALIRLIFSCIELGLSPSPSSRRPLVYRRNHHNAQSSRIAAINKTNT